MRSRRNSNWPVCVAYSFEYVLLGHSAANLRLPIDLDAVRADVARLLDAAAGEPDPGCLRIVLTRGGRRLLLTESLPEHAPAIRLATVTYAPVRLLDGIKSLSYGANMLATRLAQEQGADEALLVTPHGRVLEAPTSSIFWVAGGVVRTPPLSDHILASITRALAIELAGAEERSCTLDELLAADEAFLASTTRELQPVASVDGRRSERAPAGRGFARSRPARATRARARADPRATSADRDRMRVLTVIGNRPQFIKASAVSSRLRALGEEVTVHTGQHYDAELSQVFFDELELPPPEHLLGIGGGTNTAQTARMLAALEPLLADVRPDAVLVYGDTNSTLAGALAAVQAGIPVAHVEAGHALVRPRDAGGGQPRRHRPPQRAAAVPVADGRRQPARASRSRARSSWSAT